MATFHNLKFIGDDMTTVPHTEITPEDDAIARYRISELYRIYLKRLPADHEISGWLPLMHSQGEFLLEQQFYRSPEHLNLLSQFKKSTDSRALYRFGSFQKTVKEEFKKVLGRDPNIEELDHYAWYSMQTIDEGGNGFPSWLSMHYDISTSTEAVRKEVDKPFEVRLAQNSEYIKSRYLAMTGREATPAELEKYVALLFQGILKFDIEQEIGATPEAQAHDAALNQRDPPDDYYVTPGYFDNIEPLPLYVSSDSVHNNYQTQTPLVAAIASSVDNLASSFSNLSLVVDPSSTPFTGINPAEIAKVVHENLIGIQGGPNAVVEVRASRPDKQISVSNYKFEKILLNDYPNNPGGAAPVLYRTTFYPANEQTLYLKTYSIILGGAVHENLTAVAAVYAGIKEKKKIEQLTSGVLYPDAPEGIFSFFKYKIEGTLSWESHHGILQYWHSMVPSGVMVNNAQVQDMMINQLSNWYRQAQETDNYIYLGRMLHTVQDSFSQSHTYRNANGEIENFYNYNNQDPDKHALFDKGRWNDVIGATSAILSSIGVLNAYLRGDSVEQIREYLKGVFKLNPTTAGNLAGAI